MSVQRGALRKVVDDLVTRVSEIRLPNIRHLLAPLRDLVDRAADGVGELGPRIRPAAERLRGHIAGLTDRVAEIRLQRDRLAHRSAQPVPGDTRHGFRALWWRLQTSRLGRSADGIIVVPLLAIVLVLGIFAATAATSRSSDKANYAVAPTGMTGDVSTGEVVTQTITRDGETLRIVRYRTKPGRVVLETISGRSVTLPGSSVTLSGGNVTLPGETKTVVHTHVQTQTVTNTVTTEQIITVTETQPGPTVIVTETVPGE
jgi:hypothetical protein